MNITLIITLISVCTRLVTLCTWCKKQEGCQKELTLATQPYGYTIFFLRPQAQHAQTAPPTSGGQLEQQQQQRPTPKPNQTRQQHAPSGQEAAQPSAARPSSEEGSAAQQLAGCKRRDRPESQSPVAERSVLAALANAAA